METNVSISLVIPIYGVERYIVRFAESVLGQAYPFVQYIFVNDGTKDSSMNILESLIEKRYRHLRDRIVMVRQENAGLPAARKKGMEYATGDYVWHIDPDDWIEKDALSRIAECAAGTGADIIYFNFWKEYGSKARLVVEKAYTDARLKEYQRDIFNHRAYGCLWNKCIRRRLYVDNDVMFPKYSYAEDITLTSQLVGYADSISYLDASLYHYRKDNPHSISRIRRKTKAQEAVLNFLSLYERFSSASFNPVASILDDMFYRVGWYTVTSHLNMFRRYAYLSGSILNARICTRSYVSVPFQIILKIYALIIGGKK